jgi:hypothetical protein
MAYSDVALLSADNDFINRTRACVVTEGEADPLGWTSDHIWQMASAPTFGDKYAYALLNGVDRPGNDQSVISDPEILSAVQAIRGPVE